jgi:hypothetical protein
VNCSGGTSTSRRNISINTNGSSNDNSNTISDTDSLDGTPNASSKHSAQHHNPNPNTNTAPKLHNYIVDFGKNFQGGLNLTITNPLAIPVVITVGLGEELNADGSVMCCPARSDNTWFFTYTLAPAVTQTISMHEYAVFRWAQVRLHMTVKPLIITLTLTLTLAS